MLELAASHTNSTRSIVIGIIFLLVGAGSLAARGIRARYPDRMAPVRQLNIPRLPPRVDVTLSAITTVVGVVLILANV